MISKLNVSDGKVYEFDEFRLDASKRLLTKCGENIPLMPRAFDILLYLLTHAGDVVEKAGLISDVWGNTFVEDNNLTQNISVLRRTLGEKHGENRFIATIPGRGYKFVAEVHANEHINGLTVDEGTMLDNSIAVLSFKNLGADPDIEYVCEGLAEELINALAKSGRLKVAARTSAFSFKNSETPIDQIGKFLRVETVLEGSVRRAGERFRILARLVSTSNGYTIWSESYDRAIQDIFEVQEEIALAVVDALKIALLTDEREAVVRRYTTNPEARLAYLKGQYHRWRTTKEDFAKSIRHFQRSVELDPSYAIGHWGVSTFYGYGTAWGFLPIHPDIAWPIAEASTRRALELAGHFPEIRLSLAAYRLVNYRDWYVAGAEIRSIAEDMPGFAEIHHLYSFYLLTRGSFDEAIAEARVALSLEPFSVTFSRFVGLYLYFTRRYDEAIDQLIEALELEPNNTEVHEILGEIYLRNGMPEEAIESWRTAARISGDDEVLTILSSVRPQDPESVAGAMTELANIRMTRLAEESRSVDYVPSIRFARLSIAASKRDEALDWIEKACGERNVFPLLFAVDPFYDSIRDEPRFIACVRRVGSPPFVKEGRNSPE